MRIPDLVTQMMPRVQRLGFTDPATGKYDPEEIADYCLVALRYIANRWNLIHFYAMNRNLLRTVIGIESYLLPDHYGFAPPEEPERSGLAITDTAGDSPRDLRWYPPQQYELLRSATTGRPVRFTLAENKIWLQPTPDAGYVVQAIEKPAMDANTDIPDAYVDAVTSEALYRLASDLGKITPTLLEERIMSSRAAVNGEARLKTRFQAASYNRSLRGWSRRWRR